MTRTSPRPQGTDARAALTTRLAGLSGPPRQEEPVIGQGSTWARALESVPWGRGDVLVIGSSRSARSPRVFLGGTASKIARHAPVPVIVVPRSRS
jgi:nucleotide-binding universal stress UspA family protein